MFAARLFPGRYFPRRYFPAVGAGVSVPPATADGSGRGGGRRRSRVRTRRAEFSEVSAGPRFRYHEPEPITSVHEQAEPIYVSTTAPVIPAAPVPVAPPPPQHREVPAPISVALVLRGEPRYMTPVTVLREVVGRQQTEQEAKIAKLESDIQMLEDALLLVAESLG